MTAKALARKKEWIQNQIDKTKLEFDSIEKRMSSVLCGDNKNTLDSLKKIDNRVTSSIKLIRKLMNFKKRMKASDSCADDLAHLLSVLEKYSIIIKTKYISLFSEIHSCHWSEDEVQILSKKIGGNKNSLGNSTFNKFLLDLIPSQPKDEYPNARALKRNFVIHSGPTNTGKTYTALQALKSAKIGVYLAPLRLLALEVYQTLNDSGTPCSLITGEEELLTMGALHLSSTIEKFDTDKRYDIVVIDEAQMLSDRQRGNAWTRAILGALSSEIHICCSPIAVELITKIITECGDSYIVKEYNRDTELVFEQHRFIFPESVQQGDALVAFSKRMVLSIACVLSERGFKCSIIYGDLPPDTRKKQMQLFLDGDSDIVVSTDAIGMGLNFPIKRVVFMETEKYDGWQILRLRALEIQQIAGRAGRKNIYEIGLVNCLSDRAYVNKALSEELENISKAYYVPSKKFILSLSAGTLHERILACMRQRAINCDKYFESDVSQAISLLKILKSSEYLTQEEKYNLAFIPFDCKIDALMSQWQTYVSAYKKGTPISIPSDKPERDLSKCETYYKQLDLYYSFCKVMNIEFDITEVSNLKKEVAQQIHDLLLSSIKHMGKKCRCCGKKLNWDFPYSMCEICYGSQFVDYSDDWH